MSSLPSALATYSAELEYARLPKTLRDEVDRWHTAIRAVLETKPRMTAYQRAAEYLGVTEAAVRAKFARFQREGWRAFIDARKKPHDDQNLPEAFLEWYLVTVCGGNQRKNRPAHSKLLRMWQAGEAIPGYAQLPPIHPGTDAPFGWSYSNLNRAIRKNPRCRFLLTLRRQGPVAAASLLPNRCLSTRVDVKPGAVYIADDRWIDFEIIVSGQPEPCRSIELGFGDFASTKKVCFGVKPQLRLTRKSKRQRTKEADMRLLLAQLLCLIGYHRDGVTLIVEHGTAAISPELELELCQLSGGTVVDGRIVTAGLIRVQRSGFQGGVRMLGGYLGKRLGNFKAKAGYESSHNLYHNEGAGLPAQSGKNPDFAPEDQARRKNEDARLMTAMLALRPELRDTLQFGHLHFKAFFQAYLQVKQRIEDRWKHRIQDWEECGYIIREYRTTFDPKAWRPRSELAALPPLQRQQIEALINAVPNLQRTRRMSPNEVWQRGQGDLVVLPMHAMRLIMGESLMEPRRVQKNGEFVVTSLGDSPLHFVATATDDHGAETILMPGREYRTWLNDFDPSILFVEEMDGRYVGICRPVDKVAPTDIAGRARAVREGEKRLALAMKPYVEQGQQLLEDRARDLNANARTFENAQQPRPTEAEQRFAEHPAAPSLDDFNDVAEPVQEPGSDVPDPLDITKLL